MSTKLRLFNSLLVGLMLCPAAWAQSSKPPKDSKSGAEEMRYYKKWLDEDVLYIIVPEEKSVFKSLTTSEEREKFIEEFWRRRDPSPETMQNEAKEEHYRRIAYANDHFASGKPGWMTDRGRMYITHGPPDRKETNPTGTHLFRPDWEGGTMTTYPFEVWEYRYLEGIGTDISIEFVDKSGTNNYEIALYDYEKDALFSITGSHVIQGDEQTKYMRAKDQPFERLDVYTKLHKPPEIKFKKLEEAVTAKVNYKQLPVESQDNYVRLTDESVLTAVAIELENKNLTFEGVGDTYQATVNIYGRVSDISKRVVEVFEDVVNAHQTGAEMNLKENNRGKSIYQKKMTLRPGRYVIDAVAEDTLSGRMGTVQKLLLVPKLGESVGTLTTSSFILASAMVPVTTREDLQSQFVLGDVRVVPNVMRRYSQGGKVAFYLQVYNLALDQTSQKASVDIVVNLKKGTQVLRQLPASDLSVQSSGQQITMTGVGDIKDLAPGEYGLEATIVDRIANKNVVRTAGFSIQ